MKYGEWEIVEEIFHHKKKEIQTFDPRGYNLIAIPLREHQVNKK